MFYSSQLYTGVNTRSEGEQKATYYRLLKDVLSQQKSFDSPLASLVAEKLKHLTLPLPPAAFCYPI